MVAATIPAEIVVTPSNDPRSYRINSDKLLATGFRPKTHVDDTISELAAHTRDGRVDEPGSLLQFEMDAQKGGRMNPPHRLPVSAATRQDSTAPWP